MKKRNIFRLGLATFLAGVIWFGGNLWLDKLKEKYQNSPPPKRIDYQKETYKVLENQSQGREIDIMFFYTDHFELQDTEEKNQNFRGWIERYPEVSRRHTDSDGEHPKHTFFYLPIEPEGKQLENLLALNELIYNNFGEVEIHLHHGGMGSEEKDIEDFNNQIEIRKEFYSKTGALITAEKIPRKVFGFIHGNWALDNSWFDGIHQYCGINRELELLSTSGCYADFTFPTPSGPEKQLSIFYSRDDSDPASFDKIENIRAVVVGGSSWGNLLHIEGPLYDCLGDKSSTAGVTGELNMLNSEHYEYRIYNWIANKPNPDYNSEKKKEQKH